MRAPSRRGSPPPRRAQRDLPALAQHCRGADLILVDADRGAGSLDEVIADDDEVAIAAVTVAELLAGVLLADESHRAGRQQFVDVIRAAMPVVDHDSTVAAAQARLLVEVRRHGRPRGAHDLIIAARPGDPAGGRVH